MTKNGYCYKKNPTLRGYMYDTISMWMKSQREFTTQNFLLCKSSKLKSKN